MTEDEKKATPIGNQDNPVPPPKQKTVEGTQAKKVSPQEDTNQAAQEKTSPETQDRAAKPSQPSAKDLLEEEVKEIKIRRAKGSKNVAVGIVYILATFNNTKVTFTDARGHAISWSSAGKCHFRGSRKSTAYAAQVVTQDAGRRAMSHGMKEVEVRLKGPGMGRDSAVRALQSLGFIITTITDVTPIPHNGCRPRKRRRV